MKKGTLQQVVFVLRSLGLLTICGVFPPFVPLKRYLKVFKFSYRSSCQFHTKGAPLTLRGF